MKTVLPCHSTDVWDVEMWTTARSSLLGCPFWKIRRWIQTFFDRRNEQESILHSCQERGKGNTEERAGVKEIQGEFVFCFPEGVSAEG